MQSALLNSYLAEARDSRTALLADYKIVLENPKIAVPGSVKRRRMHRWRGQSKRLLLRGWRAAQLGHHIWQLPGLLVGQGHARLLLLMLLLMLLLLRLLQCLELEHLLLHLLLLACRSSWWSSCAFRLFVRVSASLDASLSHYER